MRIIRIRVNIHHFNKERQKRMNNPDQRQTWRWPIAIGAVTTFGLGAALVSDSWGDYMGWVCLGMPVIVALNAILKKPILEKN
jgi:hypothetical protein